MSAPKANKSLSERAIQAMMFEGLALLIFSPIVSIVMDKSLAHTATLTVMMATTAMVWNVIYNWLFDRVIKIKPENRRLGLRILHAAIFESGLILTVVPLIAWWFQIGLIEALVLDLGLLLLFFPYTIAFNWAYDIARASLVNKRQSSSL